MNKQEFFAKLEMEKRYSKSRFKNYKPPQPVRRPSSSNIPSKDSGIGNAFAKDSQVYTGDAMIGIGQLHKSNAVPIFSQEEAIDISKMRR
jgi:hypothetical protein